MAVDAKGNSVYATGDNVKAMKAEGKPSSIKAEAEVSSLAVSSQGLLAIGLPVSFVNLAKLLRQTF